MAGDLLYIQEQESNDLIVLDHGGVEQRRYEGNDEAINDLSKKINPHFTGEGNNFIWFCGNRSVKIYDMITKSSRLHSVVLPSFEHD